MEMTDPIHEQCGYEVSDSGDSHVPNHLEPIRCGDDDCLKLITPGEKYHVHLGTIYCDRCYHAES